MPRPSIPGLDDLYEREFWNNVAGDAQALQAMDMGLIPKHPDVEKYSSRGFLMSFKCLDCPNVHKVRGSYAQVSMAVQVLILRGVTRIDIEETHTHDTRVEQEAEAALAEGAAPVDLSAILTRKP